MRELQFENMDELEQAIRRKKSNIAYVTVQEVLDRQRCETLARLDYNAEDLGPWIESDEDPERDRDEDAPSIEDLDLAEAAEAPDDDALATAACGWVRHIIGLHMAGREEATMKVNLWKPKGVGCYYSTRVLCRDPEFDPGTLIVPAPPATVLPTSFPDTLPEGRTWRALGEGYTNLIGLLQNGYAHLSGLQNTTITTQNAQIIRLQRVLEAVLGELTKMKVGLSEVERGQRVEDGEAKVREELGRQFIAELGTFGRAMAAAKFGMAPELVELADLVTASPELAEALKAPEVRKLLKDEKTRKELAALLVMAAKSATPPAAEEAAA